MLWPLVSAGTCFSCWLLGWTNDWFLTACLLNCCWSSPAQWFLVPNPTGSMTIFYSLTALGAFRHSLVLTAKAKIIYDRQSVVQSTLVTRNNLWPKIKTFVTARRLRVCSGGAHSLTRGRVCRLQLVSVFASAVIFESEFRGTNDYFTVSDSRLQKPGGLGPRNYILQEQDDPVTPPGTEYPIRRLRLAGLWWRYSNPPPCGGLLTATSQRQSNVTTDGAVGQSVLK
jgi:hypothetical protein